MMTMLSISMGLHRALGFFLLAGATPRSATAATAMSPSARTSTLQGQAERMLPSVRDSKEHSQGLCRMPAHAFARSLPPTSSSLTFRTSRMRTSSACTSRTWIATHRSSKNIPYYQGAKPTSKLVAEHADGTFEEGLVTPLRKLTWVASEP